MEPANCKCSSKGRNLVVCIDGTSNQFGIKNTNVVELYSKIEKTEDSKQLTYYNSGIGTYAEPSWKSVNYLMQVVDNTIDLAIAWNFEKIVIGAYRWLSDKYQENDRIFLFGFSRGAYQVRALAGMIRKVGLIHEGNEEQIPFAYALYATHTEELATRFKTTFSRENVQVHFVGVWDTVSSVGVIRGKSLPLTDSADHICFFRHALALDERRVKFLPEYVHGGVCEKPTMPEHHSPNQNASPHIKEVWFPGTHSDIGGGNQTNLDLDLGGTPFLWMSFEAVSAGLRLRPTKVEWNLNRLQDVKESLTGVWHTFEWMPFKRLSYHDESSTVYRFHKGRGRKIKPGQKVHSSVAFCDDSYHPRAILPGKRCLYELVGKGSRSNREWVKGWEDLIEMDIFDLSLMSNVIEALKSGTGSESRMWVHRLTAMTSTGEGLNALRDRPNAINDLVQIFTCAGQPAEVQECVTAILEKSPKDHTSKLLSLEHRLWLLRVARETSEMNRRSFAVNVLVHSLCKAQSCDDILDEHALAALDEMARDEQQPWLTDGAFAMFTTILSQSTLSQKLFAANTLDIVRKRFTAEDSRSQEVAKHLFKAILQSAENRQRLFDNDAMHSLLTKIGKLNDTGRLLFTLFLVKQYEYLPNGFFTLLTSKLWDEINDPQVSPNTLRVLIDTLDSDGLRKRMWSSEIVKALHQGFDQLGSPVRSLVSKLYRKCITYDASMGDEKFTESLRNQLFDAHTIGNLWHALRDGNQDVRKNSIDFLIAAMSHEDFRDKLFDADITAALQFALGHEDSNVRKSTAEFLTVAMAQDRLRDKIFDTKIVTTLESALRDTDSDVRRHVVNFFTAATTQEGFRDKIFDAEIVIALIRALGDGDYYLRRSVVNVFTAAAAQEGFRDKIFDAELVTALVRALGDTDSDVRGHAVGFFTVAIAQEGFRDKIFDTEIVPTLVRALGDRDSYLRSSVVNVFTAATAQEGFRDKIFDAELVTALVRALGDTDPDVRCHVGDFFAATAAQEGFRDKIFDAELVTALVRALGDKDADVRCHVVDFFTAATAQEGFRDKIFDAELVTALVRALGAKNADVKCHVVDFFTAATAQERFRDTIFDAEIVTALVDALRAIKPRVRWHGVNFFTAAAAQEGFRDKIFDTKAVAALVCALEDDIVYVRRDVVHFFTAATAQEGFRDKIFDTTVITALVRAVGDEDSQVSSLAVGVFAAAAAQEGFRDKMFDTELVTALVCALGGKTLSVQRDVVFPEGFRDKIFDTETIAALVSALVNRGSHVRSRVVDFFTAATAQEGFRDKIFDAETVAALVHALGDTDSYTRRDVVGFFTAAAAQEGLRDKIFDTETVAALVHALGDTNHRVRHRVVDFFTAAAAQEGFRDTIFDTKIVTALVRALGDTEYYVSSNVVNFFTAATAQEEFRDKIFDTETIAALVHVLGDTDSYTRRDVVGFFTAAAAQEGFRDKIFDTETVAALAHALADTDSEVRRRVVDFFTTAAAQEGFRDKIFDTKIITALVGALGDIDSGVRSSVVSFFTAATAQAGFRHKIFDDVTIARLLEANLSIVELWSHDFILPRAYNHFITSTLCQQLSSGDSSLEAQTHHFVSEAIQYDDIHTRICTAELRKHFCCPHPHDP